MDRFLSKNTMVGKQGREQFEQAIQQIIQSNVPSDTVGFVK